MHTLAPRVGEGIYTSRGEAKSQHAQRSAHHPKHETSVIPSVERDPNAASRPCESVKNPGPPRFARDDTEVVSRSRAETCERGSDSGERDMKGGGFLVRSPRGSAATRSARTDSVR